MGMLRSVLKIRFQAGMQYRAAAWAGVSTQFFWGMMLLMIYRAFYDNAATEPPLSGSQLATYVWLGQAFLYMTCLWIVDRDIVQLISSGDIAYELSRPVNLYVLWFAKILSGRATGTFLRCIPILLACFLLPNGFRAHLPVSVSAFCLFCVSLVLGVLILVSLLLLLYSIGFYTINVDGFVSIFVIVAGLFSGEVVPIALFPTQLQKIAYFLPFPYLHDLAYRIYCGSVGLQDGLKGIAVQWVWLIAFVVCGYALLQRGIRRTVAQGG